MYSTYLQERFRIRPYTHDGHKMGLLFRIENFLGNKLFSTILSIFENGVCPNVFRIVFHSRYIFDKGLGFLIICSSSCIKHLVCSTPSVVSTIDISVSSALLILSRCAVSFLSSQDQTSTIRAFLS